MATIRRTKWYPPPPPSPRILHLPRRPRRKTTKTQSGKSLPPVKESETRRNERAKLETLFDQERFFSRTVPIVLLNSGDCDDERRERVEEDFELTENFGEEDIEEEKKWKFQVEILRAECNFLRMEREVALKKLEMNRVQTKKTLRSAVQTLILGKKKIYEGKNVDVVLEEEIEDLEMKLDELQRRSGVNIDVEVRKCNNFDKKASVLQRKLETLGFEEKCVKEIREMAESSLSIKTSCRFNESMISSSHRESRRFTDVDILGRKMEGLSKGMQERMEEEYLSMLYSSSSSSSATASATSSSSTSNSNRFEFPSSSSSTFVHQDHRQEMMFREEKVCSGRCKAIVRKIVEQVRAEMDQWSQMQEMLGRVREEMEELQSSRDFWQNRALDSDDRVQSLQSAVQEWKQKARFNENKVSELEKQVSDLHIELGRLKTERNRGSSRPRCLASTPLIDLYSQKEKEKRVLICSLKENHNAIRNNNQQMNKEFYCDEDARRKGSVTGNSRIMGPKRSPFREIENSSSPINPQQNNMGPKRLPFRETDQNSMSPQQNNMGPKRLPFRETDQNSMSPQQNNMGPKRLPFRETDQNSMSPINRQQNNMGSNRSPFRENENSSSSIYCRQQHNNRGEMFPWH